VREPSEVGKSDISKINKSFYFANKDNKSPVETKLFDS